VFEALDTGAWDVAFLANEPERAQKIVFSPPYAFIDGAYLVRKDSPIQTPADADRAGVRIAVGRGAAYDLVLSRTLKNAELVRFTTGNEAIAMFQRDRLDAAAGVRQALMDAASAAPDLRVLEGSFTRIEQAVAVPRGRDAGATYVAQFLEEMKASGAVRRALDATGQSGATVAPPAR
jgi:polar amino acid transport system substrate-binding protein